MIGEMIGAERRDQPVRRDLNHRDLREVIAWPFPERVVAKTDGVGLDDDAHAIVAVGKKRIGVKRTLGSRGRDRQQSDESSPPPANASW